MTTLLSSPLCYNKTKIEGDNSKVVVAFFIIIKEKTKRWWQFYCRHLLCYNKTKIKGNGSFVVIAFFVATKEKTKRWWQQQSCHCLLPCSKTKTEKGYNNFVAIAFLFCFCCNEEGDGSKVVVAFFIATKEKTRRLKRGSLPSSSHFGSRFKLPHGSCFKHFQALTMEFVGPLQRHCHGSCSNHSRTLAMEWVQNQVR